MKTYAVMIMVPLGETEHVHANSKEEAITEVQRVVIPVMLSQGYMQPDEPYHLIAIEEEEEAEDEEKRD